MDRESFQNACELVLGRDKQENGIGTYGEKTLHMVLKNYLEPDSSFHEVPVGSFIADIFNDGSITEIQTRDFNKLRKKLEFFLDNYIVTIVYPVAGLKWLVWIDPDTGETTKRRKSTKSGTGREIFYELYKIKPLLRHKNLRLSILLLELEEYRYLNGWSRDRKRGSSRYDRKPLDIISRINIRCPEDYHLLIPEVLDREFTSGDFKAASGLSLSSSQTALNVLYSVGAVERRGKREPSILYERAKKENQVIKI